MEIIELDPDPKCVLCEATESYFWRNTRSGKLCNECFLRTIYPLSQEQKQNSNTQETKTKPVRKSARAARLQAKATDNDNKSNQKLNGKGKSRRNLFKKSVPLKHPIIPDTTRTANSVSHNGSIIQVGDIVSLMNSKGSTYYAQIRGLLIDTFLEKSAYLTWLLPTTYSPPSNERFDPSTYRIGPEDEQPRKLEAIKFVMHAPSSYYHDKTTPYPPPETYIDPHKPYKNFIWASWN